MPKIKVILRVVECQTHILDVDDETYEDSTSGEDVDLDLLCDEIWTRACDACHWEEEKIIRVTRLNEDESFDKVLYRDDSLDW
jgi:hypothetical protein